MRARINVLIILYCLLPIVACDEDGSVRSTSPFYKDTDVAYDPALTGEWMLYGDNQPGGGKLINLVVAEDSSTATAGPTSQPSQKPTSYKITIHSSKRASDMKAVLFQQDGERFLDIERLGTSDYDDLIPDTLTTHLVLRIKQHDDVLLLGYLRSNWASDQVPEDRRRPAFLLQTDDLKKLLSQALTVPSAFSAEYRFSRAGSDSSDRDVADYGERLMAGKYLDAGDYGEALKAVQQALNARHDKNDTYGLLGFLQIAEGDFAGGRKSVSVWTQRCRDVLKRGFGSGGCILFESEEPEKNRARLDTMQHIFLGSSYFAEQNWKEAERELALAIQSGGQAEEKDEMDDTAALLEALTLSHLGRKNDAAAMLKAGRGTMQDEATRLLVGYLVGTVTERTLLETLEKLPAPSNAGGECASKCETYFYVGCHYVLEGDRRQARKWFEKTLEQKQFEGLEPVIARLRLKQLEKK